MSYQYRITVFTPTYTRAYIIENLYKSLCRQTYRDFEWLVVDDGSSDNTEDVIMKMKAEADFSIRYYKKENGGKHTAINMGLELAQGELFFTVDSDDWLTDDALEKVVKWEAELPKDGNFCGFAGRLQDTAGQLSGAGNEKSYFDGTTLDRYGAAGGERAMVFYTQIHKKYPYPVYEGERFLTEAVTWNRMARDGYQFRYYNDVIWIYEYQPDGLTGMGPSLYQRNLMGYGLWIRERSDILGERGMKRFMTWYSYCCEMKQWYTPAQIAKSLGIPAAYVWMILLLHRVKNIGRK